MKKIVASVGLVALGASGLQAASSPITLDAAKPFSISASLRGFYDDNINSAPDNAVLDSGGVHYYRSSVGFEVSPSLIVNWTPVEQTTIGIGYTYTFKYYENKPLNNADNFDQTHKFDLSLDHAFSERYQVSVKDSFVIGQEPDLFVDAGCRESSAYRAVWSGLARGETMTTTIKCHARGGRPVWLNSIYAPILDESGRPYKIVEYSTDFTAEALLAEQLQTAVHVTQLAVKESIGGDLVARIEAPQLSGEVGQMVSDVNSLLNARMVLVGRVKALTVEVQPHRERSRAATMRCPVQPNPRPPVSRKRPPR